MVVVALASWDGPSPIADEWMDGRAQVLHYGTTAADRITVISVPERPAQELSATGGVASSSAGDAMHAAVTAAVDIVMRSSGSEIDARRQQAKEILSDPAEELDWQPVVLHLAGESTPGLLAVLDGAIALYAQDAHNGVFIGLAAASSIPAEKLAMSLTNL